MAPWRYRLGTAASFIELGDVETPSPGDPLYGVVRGSFDASEPGRLAMDVLVQADTSDELDTAVQAITGWLRLAERTAAMDIGSWVSFHVQRRVTSGVRYYDILSGSFQPGTPDITGTVVIGRLTLRCTLKPRGEVYTPTISGARAYGGQPWLIPDVPGDAPALVRFNVTLSAAQARLRMARRAGDGITASDWNPWIDLTAVSPATDEVAAAAHGGGYARRPISGASWLDIASGSLDAGPYNRGRMDLWLRMRDNATAMADPTSLTATPTPGQVSISSKTITPDTPVETVTESSAYSTPGRRQTKTDPETGLSGGTQAVAASWSPTTVDGNTWLGIIAARSTSGGGSFTASTPSGWEHVKTITQAVGTADACALMFYVRPDAPASSGSQSWTITRGGSGNWEARLWMAEIENVPAESLVAFLLGGSDSDPSGSVSVPTPNAYVVAAAVAGASGAAPGIWFGGFGAVSGSSGQGAEVAERLSSEAGSVGFSVPINGSATLENVAGMIAFAPIVTDDSTSTFAPSANPPGVLNPGNYTIYVQAIDEHGNYGLRSTVVANSTAAVTVANSSVYWNWADVSGAVEYRVVVEYGGNYHEWFAATSEFTLTDLSTGTQVGKAPSAITVAARVQAVDISGNRSNATATTTSSNTVSNANGAIAYSWTAPTGTPQIAYYVITLSLPGSVFREFNTTDASTSFTIRDFEAGADVTALPATSGATASRNFVRASVGNAVFAAVQAPATGDWYNVHVATTDLLERLIDGSTMTLPIVIEAVSGGGPAANVDVDAIWAVPHDEPQVAVRTADLTTLTSVWALETDRRGVATIAYRTSGGTPTAPLPAQGAMLMDPGDNLVSPLLDGSGGVSSISPTATLTNVIIHPRFHWSAP